jgi:hypothetical protein
MDGLAKQRLGKLSLRTLLASIANFLLQGRSMVHQQSSLAKTPGTTLHSQTPLALFYTLHST